MTLSPWTRLAALALVLTAGSARAQHRRYPEDTPRRLSVDARTAYGLPMGRFFAGEDDLYLLDVYSAVLPLQVGLALHVTRALALGAYGQYGFGVMNGLNCERVGCEGSTLRAGLSAQYFFRAHSAEPWVELSAGYSQASVTLGGQAAQSTTFHGFDGAVSAGGDYPLAGGLVGGPLVGMTLGSYLQASSPTSPGAPSAIPEPTVHAFLFLGARLRFSQ